MTREELEFWGQPPYQCTITNNVGHPIGQLDADGTFIPVGASNVNKPSKANGDYIVTWDGSKPDPMPNGSTKGRLLPVIGPRYVDSLVAIGFYARAAADDEAQHINDETTKRIKWNVAQQAKANRKNGKQKAKEVGESK